MRGAGNAAEVDALQGRVRELEGQLTESKRMLELRNTELADLQAKLAASQQQPRRRQPAPASRRSEQPAAAARGRDARAGSHHSRSSRADAGTRADAGAEPPAATPTPEQQPSAAATGRAKSRRWSTRSSTTGGLLAGALCC